MIEQEWEMESSTDDELVRPSRTMEFAKRIAYRFLARSLTDLDKTAFCYAESDTAVQNWKYDKQKDERLKANGKSVVSAKIKAISQLIYSYLSTFLKC